jgi:integrase
MGWNFEHGSRDFMIFLLLTGMRVGETKRLQWSQQAVRLFKQSTTPWRDRESMEPE